MDDPRTWGGKGQVWDAQWTGDFLGVLLVTSVGFSFQLRFGFLQLLGIDCLQRNSKTFLTLTLFVASIGWSEVSGSSFRWYQKTKHEDSESNQNAVNLLFFPAARESNTRSSL